MGLLHGSVFQPFPFADTYPYAYMDIDTILNAVDTLCQRRYSEMEM